MQPFDAEAQSGVLCAVTSSPGERLFGFATFDQERRAFRVCEYLEDAHVSRSEALLLQVQPRSICVAISDEEDGKKLARVAESCGVELSEVKGADVRQVDLEQDLSRLLEDALETGSLSRHLEEQRRKQGMRALAALIARHGLLQEPAYVGACTLGLYPLRSFVYLDKAAFSALNVLPRPDESLRSHTSLMGFLNRCRSEPGTRRLREWLTQPLTSPDAIADRHDVVEALCGAEELLRSLEGFLRRVPDLERMAMRLHRTQTKSKAQKATLEDMVHLYHCLLSCESMASSLSTYQGGHGETLARMFTTPLQACVADFQNFRSLVEQTIDLQQAEQRNYCISSTFDKSLGELAGQRDRVMAQMEQVRAQVDGALGLGVKKGEKTVSICECPEGHGLRVTKKHQGAVQQFKGKPALKVLAIKKQEFIFTTPELDKLNKGYKEALERYEAQSAQLAAKALTVASSYVSVVERLNDVTGSLDVLAAFARVVLSAPCAMVRAKVDPSCKTFQLEGASHVLVVANSDKSFIANDLDMDREDSRLHLITGPNMGGKSTYIRSVALIALLNQVGMFVPCKSATLPVFDAIMCRVGASDMQLRGISTFMAEMLEASCILNTATDRSLVIVDELGRGTSTSDGFGIAWAIARHLAEETRCFSLFATHFHELAALQDGAQGVRNRHATAAVDTKTGQLTFLYALRDGVADQSYGAHVAELAGFPVRVVAAARRKAEEFEAGSEFGAAHNGAALKRARTATAGADDAWAYLMAARDEDDFARRAMEQLPQLQAALGTAQVAAA